MPDSNYTDLTFVLDGSGSMVSIAEAIKEGFDGMITEQKKVPGKMRVTLVQFDTDPWHGSDMRYQYRYQNADIHDVKPLQFEPGNNTPLNDAVGRAIRETGQRLSNMPEHERPGKVFCVIMTDGQENASREFRGPDGRRRIAEMIKHQQEAYSWTFVFLGANQNSFEVAVDMGVTAGNVMNFAANKYSTQDAFTKMSGKFAAVRSRSAGHESLTRGQFYTAADYADQEALGADNSLADQYGATPGAPDDATNHTHTDSQ
jgi:hypothetical protein